MIEELLEAVLQGSQAPAQQARKQGTPANPWMDLLEDVLGGQQPTQQQASPASLGMEDILGMVLGGGRQGAVGGNPLLAPFTNMLAERLGLSPQMASVIVSAAFGLIMGKMGAESGGVTRGAGAVQNPRGLANGLNLDDLLDEEFLKRSGVTEKVAKQTGLDPAEAEKSLLKALEMLGLEPGKTIEPRGQAEPAPRSQSRTTPKPSPKKAVKRSARAKSADLKHLLDDWQVHG